MEKILLSVDSSLSSLHAAEYLAKIFAAGNRLEIHLLNVQEPMLEHIATRFSEVERNKMYRENSEAEIKAVREFLMMNNIPSAIHFAQGAVGPIIAQKAKELGCDRIVMGTRGHAALLGMVLGSIAQKVIHFSDVPVTLVK
jgi:nucleotide-binding universal stress UspA family protein